MWREWNFVVGKPLLLGVGLPSSPVAEGGSIEAMRRYGSGEMRNLIRWVVSRITRRIARQVWLQEPPPVRSQYEAIALLATRYGFHSLSAAELRAFSQNGEDGVLAEIFSRIGTTNQFFVEFGVQDGLECNTRLLMEVLGWSGVYFEPDLESFPRLSARLQNRDDVLTLCEFVTPDNVNTLFAQAEVPAEFDLLSIDIDGQDYWVWDALEGFRPRVVVIEYNAALPVEPRVVEKKGAVLDRRTSFNFVGASLGAMRDLGRRKGYTLVHAELAGVNLFFIRDDLANTFEPSLARGSNHYLRGYTHPRPTGQTVEV